MNEELQEKFIEHYNKELSSAFIYLAMSIHMAHHSYMGFAAFFDRRFREELDHAQKFKIFLLDIEVHPTVRSIPKPQAYYDSVTETLKAAYDHEKVITESIYDLYQTAEKHDDYKAKPLLVEFLKEQNEEAAMFQELYRIASQQLGEQNIFMLDRELRNKLQVGYPSVRRV